MPRTSTSRSTTSRPSTSATTTDAIQMLTKDHRSVDALFKQFDKLAEGPSQQKNELVQQICEMLEVHATIEEEIFYPIVREVLGDQKKPDDLLNEAEVEHEHIKMLVEQLKGIAQGDELFDARVTVLKEYVKHHVQEEEGELFPKVKKSNLDLEALGDELQARKTELGAS